MNKTPIFYLQRMWLVERVKWRENVRDINNNNADTSTSAFLFAEFTFRLRQNARVEYFHTRQLDQLRLYTN